MKVAFSGGFQQRLALRLRRLDVVAEHVVVTDLELADAGLPGVSRLQVGDDPPALVAQGARLVERRQRAGADEAAVAFDERQVVGERRLEARQSSAPQSARKAA